MLSSKTCQPVKRRKLSVVSDEPASDNESAPESLKESTPESETMTMNEQQVDANKGLEELSSSAAKSFANLANPCIC